MIVYNVQQGTSEWLELRAGIPTASQFDLILTKSGKPSASKERYLYTLLAERLMGHPIQDHISFWMQRGSEMEKEALNFYTFQRDVETQEVGFITDDKGLWGASPDRLVEENGTLEIKCPKEWIHMGYLLESGKVYEEYKVQCQGQLWITGRQWVDVLSYSPEMPKALRRVERDEAFITLLSQAVRNFSIELESMHEQLMERGWMPEPAKPRAMTASELMREVLRESITAVK